MVSIRRPSGRGKFRGSGSQSSPNRLWTVLRFAVLGGICFVVFNMWYAGDTALNNAGHSILNIPNNLADRTKLLRDMHQSHQQQLLQRKQHEGSGKSQVKVPNHDLHDHEEAQAHAQDKHHGGIDHLDPNADAAGDGDNTEHQASQVADQNDDHNQKENASEHHKTLDNPADHSVAKLASPGGEVLDKGDLQGTGPTKLGYVMDFVYERAHPLFRHDEIDMSSSLTRNEHEAASEVGETTVKACEYYLEEDGHRRLLQHEKCRDPSAQLVVYNPASFARTWCDTTIPSQKAARLDQHCSEPVRLLEKDFPPLNGEGMHPIVIHSKGPNVQEIPADQLKDISCDTPCQIETGINNNNDFRYILGTDWKIVYTDKDPQTKKEWMTEYSKFKSGEYFATSSFKADIIVSHYSEQYNLRNRPAVDFDSTVDKGSYILSDGICGQTSSRRSRWYETLRDQYTVDSLGKCVHTTDLQAGESLDTLEQRLQVMKKYRFNLGFETSNYKDWLTGLSYEQFLSGSVPIILGPPNAAKHFPKNSAIFTNDFNHWDKLAAYVKEVAANKTLWESFHTWRNDEKELAAFEKRYEFTKVAPECRMCQWAYAKKNGLGWDHLQQKLQEVHLPRPLCADEAAGLAVQPFRELWDMGGASLQPSADSSTCTAASSLSNRLEQSGATVDRIIVQHDSVTDMTIRKVETPGGDGTTVLLKFEFPGMINSEGAFFPNSHSLVTTQRGSLMSSATMQDHKAKVTVLASWQTRLYSPKEGWLYVVIQGDDGNGNVVPGLHADENRRLRVITEDIGQLHDKMTEYFPSSFSKHMIQDFVDQLEVFHVV